MATALLVALAGGLGALARWSLTPAGATAPWATMAINVVGSLLLGLVLSLAPPTPLRVAATVGFLGGFTTFSTFTVDAIRAADLGAFSRAALLVVGSVALGLAAAWAGLRLGAAIAGRPGG